MRALLSGLAVGSDRSRRLFHLTRFRIFVVVGAAEILLESLLFDFALPRGLPNWQNPIVYANTFAKILVVAAFLLAMVLWPKREAIVEAYRQATAKDSSQWYLTWNLALFITLLLLKFDLSRTAEPSTYQLAACSGALLATGATIGLLAAPLGFWRNLLRSAPTEIAVALIGASFAVVGGIFAQEEWDSLSGATLWLSHWLLTLYEPDVLLDSANRILGAGQFQVRILAPCSGYEGAAFVFAFLSIYLWAFRRDLRFPNALLLFPICVAAIWFLNALRIALLVSIGSHVSPSVAIQGFHSVAGWVSFLAVALGTIAVSRKMAFFAAPNVSVHKRRVNHAALTYLAPFMALVAASLLASAFAPHDQWLYAVKVAAIGATLWCFRDAYLPLLSGARWSSIAIGLGIGVLWIASDPGMGSVSPLGVWLASLPVWVAVIWLGPRVLGSVALVPIAEELAFRGYLSRALISIRFENVGIGEFRLLAFVGSTVAFGLMHERWLAACLAGAIYAMLMYRTKRLSDPIVAHMASNAAIAVWAIAAQQWSLL